MRRPCTTPRLPSSQIHRQWLVDGPQYRTIAAIAPAAPRIRNTASRIQPVFDLILKSAGLLPSRVVPPASAIGPPSFWLTPVLQPSRGSSTSGCAPTCEISSLLMICAAVCCGGCGGGGCMYGCCGGGGCCTYGCCMCIG